MKPMVALPGLASPPVAKIPTLRAMPMGGALMEYLQSQELQYFERNYRTLPPSGIATAEPNKPVTVTMGAERTPANQVLVIIDYSFDVYGFSGLAPGDFVPVRPNSLATQVTWDIAVDNQREGQNVRYQVIPQPQVQNNKQFANQSALSHPQAWQFEEQRATELQGPGGLSLSSMPQRRHRDGQVKVSNQYVARSASTVSVKVSIINPVPFPIAFFEANIMGFLLPQNVFDAYQSANAPTGNPSVPVMIDQTTEPYR